MENLIQTAGYALSALKAAGADDAQVSVSKGLVEEFNADAGEFSLIRSVFSSGISMKAIKDKKKGTASVNQLDKESIDSAVVDCMESTERMRALFPLDADTMVSASFPSLPSSVNTEESSSSSSLSARNVIVSKLASLSAEQPTKAA